jgi:hypothetical protein
MRRAAAAVSLLLLAAPAASAQAPPLPDFSGVWENKTGFFFVAPGAFSTADAVASKNRNEPPLKGEYLQRYLKAKALAAAGTPEGDPTATCVFPGTPRIMKEPFPFEILVTPGRVTITLEYMSNVRRIYTDGRGHPASLVPSYNGHSIGRWEGDTLVVETVGFRDDTVLDVGVPHSDAMKVVERYHLVGPDELAIDFTITDEKAFSAPWSMTWRYARHRDWEILEYVCAENNRDRPQ